MAMVEAGRQAACFDLSVTATATTAATSSSSSGTHKVWCQATTTWDNNIIDSRLLLNVCQFPNLSTYIDQELFHFSRD